MALRSLSLKNFAVFVLVIAMTGTISFAQSQHMDMKSKTTKVSGADRPELIPDEEAYRTVFATIANQPDVFLQQLRLSRADEIIATKAISSYQKTFAAMLKNQGDSHTFIQRANALLKRTKGDLANHMSAEGYERIDAFVQEQKASITITTETFTEGQ